MKTNKTLPLGYVIPSLVKRVTLAKLVEDCQLEPAPFTGWKNLHCDYDEARKYGLRAPIAEGMMSLGYIVEMVAGVLQEGFIQGGKISLAYLLPVEPGDTLTVKGVVKERTREGEATRVVLEVWCENQRGEKVTVGTASGLAAE